MTHKEVEDLIKKIEDHNRRLEEANELFVKMMPSIVKALGGSMDKAILEAFEKDPDKDIDPLG